VDLLGVSSYFPWFKVNRSNPKDCKGDDEKKKGGVRNREKKRKAKISLKKKKQENKFQKRPSYPYYFGHLLAYYFGHCWSNC